MLIVIFLKTFIDELEKQLYLAFVIMIIKEEWYKRTIDLEIYG